MPPDAKAQPLRTVHARAGVTPDGRSALPAGFDGEDYAAAPLHEPGRRSLRKPVLDVEVANPTELPNVVGDEHEPEGTSLRSNQ